MSMSRSLCLSASGFSWWYPWTRDEGDLSYCDQKTDESIESALLACLVTSSWGVQSIDGSPVHSSMSLFVTLSIQVILMIERRCCIMKACSFFTCHLYTVQASAPYRRVDSTITQYILPLTCMDTEPVEAHHWSCISQSHVCPWPRATLFLS